MSVSGVNGSSNIQHPITVGTQSGQPTVSTTTTPTEEDVPVVESQESESPPPPEEGALPEPPADGDPVARAAWVEERLEDLEELFEMEEELQYLADHGDTAAQQLLNEMQAYEDEYEDLQEEWDNNGYEDLGPSGDLDGDDVVNSADPDIDGDTVTNEAELANGTNPYDVDTDHDGITDYGELWLRQHNYSYTWMDPLNPDANSNGILDGAELPASIRVDNNGVPITTGGSGSGTGSAGGAGGTGGTAGTGGADGASTQTIPLEWSPPSGEAQQVNASDGDQLIGGEGDVVVNLNGGNVTFSKDGDDLVITTESGTITIENYRDRKVFIEGTASGVTTNNLNSGDLQGVDSDGDGYADSGVHFGSGIDTASITSTYDPFEGNMPIDEGASTDEEVVYLTDGNGGTFNVPSEIDGVPVTAVIVTKEGDDIIVELRDGPEGNVLKRFRLSGAADEVANFDIDFQLDDRGQYFYTEETAARVYGGRGNDYITINGGEAYGKEGSDVLRTITNGAVLDGGQGDDFLEGGAGDDTLRGGIGEGMDFLSAGTGADTLEGGDGDDILVVGDDAPADSQTGIGSNDSINGGGGQDMSNAADLSLSEQSSIEVGVSEMAGLISYLQERTDEASGELLNALNDATATGDWVEESVASTIGNAASSYLSQKKTERYSSYGGAHESGFGSDDGDVPPPPDPEDPEEP